MRGVTKRFGVVTAVDDVSLDVEDGEFMVLLGPSGCGKSTILRLISGLEEPSAGEIVIGNRPVNALPPRDRDVAMVFQNYALYPHMSVYDNMAFGLRMRKTPRAEIDRRVRAAAAMLDLERLLQRKPRQLSGGERQRVALARAIVREPQVFLMDEPLSNLDAQLRLQTRSEIVKLQRRLEATVIYVTHDQTEAMTMADRVAVIRSGSIQQVDQPQRIYDSPSNLFVGGFIGSPGMNFFPGRVHAHAGALRAETDTFSVPLAPGIARSEGDAVIVGVRPEAVQVTPSQSSGGGNVGRATVDVVEPLGSEQLVHLCAGDTRFVARVDPRMRVTVGDHMAISVEPNRAIFFDPESGGRLESGAGSGAGVTVHV